MIITAGGTFLERFSLLCLFYLKCFGFFINEINNSPHVWITAFHLSLVSVEYQKNLANLKIKL